MPQPAQSPLPQIPNETVREGGRWRWHKPSPEQVAEWFNTQPLDEGMPHADYVGGVVIIPQSEKVKYQTDKGTMERYEMTFTPYVQIGTRVAYFRQLAEHRKLIPVIGPADVPRSVKPDSMYFNANMPDGLWWHVVNGDSGPVRYLCATYSVRMYEPTSYAAKLRGEDPLPVLEGSGTKQVSGGVDPNGLMKAQTGAIGRALGVAGILVVGTGIASAEDMMEFSGTAASAPGPEAAQLPPSEIAAGQPPELSADPAEALTQLRSRALALQAEMQERAPDKWSAFAAWWQERRTEAGWSNLGDAPFDAMKGIVARMERDLAEADNAPPAANAPTEGGE